MNNKSRIYFSFVRELTYISSSYKIHAGKNADKLNKISIGNLRLVHSPTLYTVIKFKPSEKLSDIAVWMKD